MTGSISDKTFFSHYILFPKDAVPKDQNRFLVASIVLGIFSMGLVHLGCWIACRIRQLKGRVGPVHSFAPNASASKIANVARSLTITPPEQQDSLALRPTKNSIVRGMLRIDIQTHTTYPEVGTIGEKEWLTHPDLKNIELPTLADWRDDPEDFLIRCSFDSITPKITDLPNSILLPGCLFYSIENGKFKYKEAGETISFVYQGRKFVLTAADTTIKYKGQVLIQKFTTQLSHYIKACYQTGHAKAMFDVYNPQETTTESNSTNSIKPPHLKHLQVQEKEIIDKSLEKLRKEKPQIYDQMNNKSPYELSKWGLCELETEHLLILEMPGISIDRLIKHRLEDGSLYFFSPVEKGFDKNWLYFYEGTLFKFLTQDTFDSAEIEYLDGQVIIKFPKLPIETT